MVDFKEFVIGLLILGGNSAATSLDDEALDFMFRWESCSHPSLYSRLNKDNLETFRYYISILFSIRGTLKNKQTVYLKTLSKREGGRSTPFQKIEKKWIFDKSWRGRGHKTYCQKYKHSILYDFLLNLAQPIPNHLRKMPTFILWRLPVCL